jgi:hypothetical protein
MCTFTYFSVNHAIKAASVTSIKNKIHFYFWFLMPKVCLGETIKKNKYNSCKCSLIWEILWLQDELLRNSCPSILLLI